MARVKPKKSLGQHFLNDRKIAREITGILSGEGYDSVLEIGPGMGILTKDLIKKDLHDFRVIEIDNESVNYLRSHLPELKNIIKGDFLKMDIDVFFSGKLAIIGNFPYNISTQILFKVLKHRDKVMEVCCMLQKEVAKRICSPPGSRTYGILSVLLQAYYSAHYMFTVPPGAFSPVPRVESGVVHLVRNKVEILDCDEDLFSRVVKSCFNQRRKILRNSVKAAFDVKDNGLPGGQLRPEELSVEQFIHLTNWITANTQKSE
jgi:16S rRNA (adenine1518-N6/adenine1519-N6)-dimethyltransferase